MQQYFYQLADLIQDRLQPGEDYTAWLSAEISDFVRFNQGRVRQAGRVDQRYLSLRLIRGRRHCTLTLSLAGHLGTDRALVEAELVHLREMLADAAEDPYLLLNREVRSTEHIQPARVPPAAAIVESVVAAAADHDLVGFLARGPTFEGFANSFGQRNWHQVESFNLDWSLYAGGDKAVKSAYAGTDWNEQTFHARFAVAAEQLALLRRPARRIPPGGYRAYLAPAALDEIFGLLNYGGFSEKALRSKRSPLIRLAAGEAVFSPLVSLAEHTAEGLGAGFQGDGFIKPPRTPLIEAGRHAGAMVSPRTAQEYGLAANGAGADEGTEALQMAAGAIPQQRVLAELGTGLYIGNLWYCNVADPANARLTGMTRFASFWVEDGEPVAPLEVMRFDDTLYRMLSSELLGLTRERELIVDTSTYGGRQTASRLLPGALIGELRLVL